MKSKNGCSRFTLYIKGLIVFTILLSQHSVAQPLQWVWAHAALGSMDDRAYSVTTDASGFVYLAGSFQSLTLTLDTITLHNSDTSVVGANQDAFIAKFNPDGNVIWAKSFGNKQQPEMALSVVTDASGFVYLTGVFYTNTIIFDNDTVTNHYAFFSSDIFLVKFSAAGTVVWAKGIGGVQDENPASIKTDLSGTIYLAGTFSSPSVVFGNDTIFNVLSNDVFIARFDSSGNPLWAKSVGTNGYDEVSSIAPDAFGGIYMVGGFAGTSVTIGDTTLNNSGYTDFFLAKYDSNGNVLWARGAGGSDYDDPSGVVCDGNGNVYVAGAFKSPTLAINTTVLTNAEPHSYDFFIAKYDSAGNFFWAKREGSTGYQWIWSFTIDASGNPVATGVFTSPTFTIGGTPLTNLSSGTGGADVFLVKFDTSGIATWAMAYGGASYEEPNSITIDASGAMYVAGSFSSPTLDMGSTTLLLGTGFRALYLAKLDITTGIAHDVPSAPSMCIFPNPAADRVFISFTSSLPSTLSMKVFNVQGEEVSCEMIGSQTNNGIQTIAVSTKKLRAGMYFIQLTNGEKTTSGKFTVQ